MQLIPVGGPLKRWHAPGVILVGDAAGLVSPLTAGGIHTALNSGETTADTIADHLLQGGPEPAATLALRRPRFRVKRLLRSAMDLAPPNSLIEAALFNSAAQALARRIYFGSGAGVRAEAATAASQRSISSW